MSVDLIILGGYLGSGKTTLMLKLAEAYSSRGHKVALITNDQGDMLVDTGTAEKSGYKTAQVSSGCFCCRFSEFMENVETFLADYSPRIIIAEPVGSCTDLVSTLAAPIQNFYRETVTLKGMYVLADGYRLSHSWDNLNLENPVTPEEVLLSHQLKEAETVLLSKRDLLDEEHLKKAEDRLRNVNKEAEIRPYSALDPEGVAELAHMILNRESPDLMFRSVELDYRVYAEAEAELGWYNGSWEFSSPGDFSLSSHLLDLSSLFSSPSLGKVSHGKIFLTSKNSSIKLSFVEGVVRADSVQAGDDRDNNCRIIINIRAKTSPEIIEEAVLNKIKEMNRSFEGSSMNYKSKALIPSPPVPEHRITIRT